MTSEEDKIFSPQISLFTLFFLPFWPGIMTDEKWGWRMKQKCEDGWRVIRKLGEVVRAYCEFMDDLFPHLATAEQIVY